jgi:3-hydroxyisobutyrate dehydrogenase-like beta-hydroxyacid dehydrogenase
MESINNNTVSETIGLIGLGSAGTAIAKALGRRFRLCVYDRDPSKHESLQRKVVDCTSITIAESVADVARRCGIILLSLPTPAASLSVVTSLSEALSRETVIVETSTVGPEDVEALTAICSARNACVVDSAIVGGVSKLAEGKAVLLVGAKEDGCLKVRPVLESLAEEIFYLGKPGNGMRTKLVVNSVAHAVMVVLVEAGALALAQGIPSAVLYRLLRRESGLLRPLTHRFGERIMKGNFEGGMSTANARKDSALVLETARALGVPLFAIQAAHSVYEIGARDGLAALDYASIARLWEKWLEVEFAPRAGESATGAAGNG